MGCRPSELPEGISVGSMVIVFSLFIVYFYTSGVESWSLFLLFFSVFVYGVLILYDYPKLKGPILGLKDKTQQNANTG